MENHARCALRHNPLSAPALCIWGDALEKRGDPAGAMHAYQLAIGLDETFIPAYRGAAKACHDFNRTDEVVNICRAWSRLEPNNPEARHMVAAITGDAVPTVCSESYIRDYFNRFAEEFDEVLVEDLNYLAPKAAAALLEQYTKVTSPELDVLDAGCGTGLCGPLLRRYSKTLAGVDLSEQIIARAKTRKCYDELIVSELCVFMESRPRSFDAIISTDVLIYFGALERALLSASRALRSGGFFIASVEALSDDSSAAYLLQKNGRYAHGESYLRQAVSARGMQILNLQTSVLRWEHGAAVPFYSIAAVKP